MKITNDVGGGQVEKRGDEGLVSLLLVSHIEGSVDEDSDPVSSLIKSFQLLIVGLLALRSCKEA